MAFITFVITIAVFYYCIKHGEEMSEEEQKASDKAYDDNFAFWPSNIDDFLEENNTDSTSST